MHIMGHVGDIETTYSTDKPIPDDVIEQMRKAFEKCLRLIETEARGIQETEIGLKMNEFKKMMLILAGYSDKEIEQGNFLGMTEEELAKLINEKKTGAVGNGNKQQVVPLSPLEEMINQGYEFVSAIPGDKAIVKNTM